MSCSAFQRSVHVPRNAASRWVDHGQWPERVALEKKPRIFDAFIFSGEVELLETRLHVLSHVVDVFVIVEADVVFSGQYPRRLVFPETTRRWGAFLERIHFRSIRAQDDPRDAYWCGLSLDGQRNKSKAVSCERYIRGSLLRQVLTAGARPDDILVLSDVDEIPRPELLQPFRDCAIFDSENDLAARPTVLALLATTYMFDVGCLAGDDRWAYGPKVGAVFQFDTHRDEPWRLECGMNFHRWETSGPSVANASWHLTNFMSPEQLALKLEGFAHFQDFSKSDRSTAKLARHMAKCSSPYPKKYKNMHRRPPKLGPSSHDALSYIHQHFPQLRARNATEKFLRSATR